MLVIHSGGKVHLRSHQEVIVSLCFVGCNHSSTEVEACLLGRSVIPVISDIRRSVVGKLSVGVGLLSLACL